MPAGPDIFNLDGTISTDRHETTPTLAGLSHITSLRVAGIDNVWISRIKDCGLMDMAQRPVVITTLPEVLDTARSIRFMAPGPSNATVEKAYRVGPFLLTLRKLFRKIIADMGCCKTHPCDCRKRSTFLVVMDGDLRFFR